MTSHKTPTLFQAFIPVIFLILLLSLNVGLFGSYALDGSNQIVLILSGAVASIVAFRLGFSWSELQAGIVKTISSAMGSILILLLIGSLAGAWMLSGVVPAMIYYGLQILSPGIFLFAACVICSIVSIATGSSWTTAATVGIALIGIGSTLGIPVGWVAGAILSGAYFGDKMSPLSDTTNLAPAMAGTDLFTHIRYMTITTGPSIVIALIVFLNVGFTGNSTGSLEEKALILDAIDSRFNITGWLFIVPLVVIILIVKKVDALPALLVGTLLAALFAFVFQPDLVMEVGRQVGGDGIILNNMGGIENASGFYISFMGMMQALFGSINFDIGIASLDENGLLSSGGMYGMLKTVWLIVAAMIFGGVMEKSGMLKRIAQAIISLVNSTGSLVTATASSCVFFNITASDQYLAIVVPGRMFADIYKEKGLAPENLSRTLEDSGTVTSVLVPWNTCGAYHSSVLGVATMTYLPYCIFNLVSPIMTILVAYVGFKIKKLKD
ncbi:MAG: Na+/H+ antiporter NhaC [Cyclobacteriaceae bacterium]